MPSCRFFLASTLLLLTAGAAGCASPSSTVGSSGGTSDAAPTTDAPPSSPDPGGTSSTVPTGDVVTPLALRALAVSTGTLAPAFDAATHVYTASSLTALAPVAVTATYDGEGDVRVNGLATASGAPQTLQLASGEDVVVRIGGEEYRILYAPPDLPVYTVDRAAGAGDEPILLAPASHWLLVVDRAGAPLFYRAFPDEQVIDFQTQRVAGARVYTYSTWDRDVILDEGFREIGSARLAAHGWHGDGPSDPHEVLLLGEEHHVVVAYVPRVVDLSGLNPLWSAQSVVTAAVIQEVDHGAVVFEWDSTSVPSLYTDSVVGNAFGPAAAADYVHLNGVNVDPTDGNFVVSLRNTSSVLKLDRATGATLWTLGGRSDQFGLPAEQRFALQHNAQRLDDGALVLFDNQYGPEANARSRALRFRLDEAQRKVTAFDVLYERPEAQAGSDYMGSVRALDASRWLVGWGGHFATGVHGPAATELRDGAVVWSLTFTDPMVFSYRANPLR